MRSSFQARSADPFFTLKISQALVEVTKPRNYSKPFYQKMRWN